MNPITRYFRTLNAAVGNGWNRFWFTPTPATTLGALRIATGLLALYAVATYAPDLERWFGEGGMISNSLVEDLYRPEGQLLGQRSLLDFVPPNLLWPAYWISLGVLMLYTLGIGGRAMAIAAAVVTISFFTRGPLVIGEFEAVLSMLLIYLCIGRCCDVLSVRSLRRKNAAPTTLQPPVSSLQPPSPFNTISLRLIQIHIVLIHLMVGWAQLAVPDSVWWSGEGMWLSARIAQDPSLHTSLSLINMQALMDRPRLIAAWSHAMTIYLLTMPALVWIRLTRPLVLAAGAIIWIAFALASGWVPFGAAMLIGLAAFIEPRSLAPTQPAGA
jgi:hypothetical protein